MLRTTFRITLFIPSQPGLTTFSAMSCSQVNFFIPSLHVAKDVFYFNGDQIGHH